MCTPLISVSSWVYGHEETVGVVMCAMAWIRKWCEQWKGEEKLEVKASFSGEMMEEGDKSEDEKWRRSGIEGGRVVGSRWKDLEMDAKNALGYDKDLDVRRHLRKNREQ